MADYSVDNVNLSICNYLDHFHTVLLPYFGKITTHLFYLSSHLELRLRLRLGKNRKKTMKNINCNSRNTVATFEKAAGFHGSMNSHQDRGQKAIPGESEC